MEHKRRVTEIEIKDNEVKSDNLKNQTEQTTEMVAQLTADNANRRELLDQTNASLTELGNML